MLRTFQRALRNWKVDLKNLNPSNLESRVPTVENWDQNCCWFEVFSYIIYIHIHCILHHKHSRSNVLYNAISKIHSCETIGTKKRHFPDRLRIHHWVHSSPGWTGARHWGHENVFFPRAASDEKEQFRSFENLTLKFPVQQFVCSFHFFPVFLFEIWGPHQEEALARPALLRGATDQWKQGAESKSRMRRGNRNSESEGTCLQLLNMTSWY